MRSFSLGTGVIGKSSILWVVMKKGSPHKARRAKQATALFASKLIKIERSIVQQSERQKKSEHPFLRALSIAAVATTVLAFWLSLAMGVHQFTAWQQTRVLDAWNILNTSAPGNSGKINAIEYLAEQDEVLRGLDLSSQDLRSGAFLRGLSVPGARLVFSNFAYADIQGADLSETNLDMAIFDNAALTAASLDSAAGFGTSFMAAGLSEANIQDTWFCRANFEFAQLAGSDLSDAVIRQSSFRHARMQGAILIGTDMRGVLMWDVDLRGANLSGAIFDYDEGQYSIDNDEYLGCSFQRDHDDLNVMVFMEGTGGQTDFSLSLGVPHDLDRIPQSELDQPYNLPDGYPYSAMEGVYNSYGAMGIPPWAWADHLPVLPDGVTLRLTCGAPVNDDGTAIPLRDRSLVVPERCVRRYFSELRISEAAAVP